MRHLLIAYLIPIAALALGLLMGTLPPPTVPALSTVSILGFVAAFGFVVYAQGWARAGIYVAIVAVLSFCAEFTLVNPAGLLTHFTYPQLGGVLMLALLQDTLVIAASYIFASALLTSRGVLATAAAAATITLVTALVAGPWGTTLGYYVYNQPFDSWPENLGLHDVPPVPWGEPIGLVVLSFITTCIFDAFGSRGMAARRLSPKWAGILYFGSQALPAWAWAAYTGRWELFVLGAALLTALAAVAFWAELFAVAVKQQTRVRQGQIMSEPKLRTYQGAVAIITGGASGIGRALGEELARRGAEVVLADLQADGAAEAAAHIRANGGKARAVLLDVTDFASVDQLVQETVAASGRLDYLFNNAGIVVAGEAHFYQIEDWHQVINVNLFGVANGVQAAYPIMRKQGFGHIVNTASVAGLVPVGGLLSYSASKHAVVGLSTSLRMEAELVGVRVSALCPGAVETPIVGGGKFGKHLQPVPER
jgi:NAD(P)-dependent dehydrogenase (short-subunit alcohol dehydrogenase family)